MNNTHSRIGIDFSINSTAITINENENIQMFSFVPNYRPETSPFKTHKAISDLVYVVSYEKLKPSKDPIEDQSIKLKNADSLSDIIIETISPFISGSPEFRIEGFSFASKGNSFIDLIIYNTFLKAKIIQKWGHCINVVPPKSLKKMYTGNGNASKCDMLRSYLKQNQNLFSDRLRDLGLEREEEFVLPKPIDDLIDSIALSSCSW